MFFKINRKKRIAKDGIVIRVDKYGETLVRILFTISVQELIF